MSFTPSEQLRAVAQIGPYKLASKGTIYSDSDLDPAFVKLDQFHSAMVVCMALLGDGDTAVFHAMEATADDGTGKTNLSGKTVTLTGDGSTPQIGVIDIHPWDLNAGISSGPEETYEFLGVGVTTDTDNDEVGACIILCEPRYQGISDSSKKNLNQAVLGTPNVADTY